MDTRSTELFEAGAVRTLQKVYSANYGAELTVCQVGYGKVDVDDVLAGKVGAETVYLSADARAFNTSEWATGDDNTGDAVYVEIARRDGRDFHGWVDATSRKVVQTG